MPPRPLLLDAPLWLDAPLSTHEWLRLTAHVTQAGCATWQTLNRFCCIRPSDKLARLTLSLCFGNPTKTQLPLCSCVRVVRELASLLLLCCACGCLQDVQLLEYVGRRGSRAFG